MTADPAKIEHGIGIAKAPAIDNESIHEGKQELALKEVDGALAFLRSEDEVVASPEDEKKLVRKVDFLIMPLLFGVYVLQFVDKSLSK